MYISLGEARAFIGIGSTRTADDDLLEGFIKAAQQAIENYCKRQFESSSGIRYYRQEHLVDFPLGSQYQPLWRTGVGFSWDTSYPSLYSQTGYTARVLKLDEDLLSITTLTNGDETTISSTSYWLEPRNEVPYQYIRLKTDEQWNFNTDGEISVDGMWGYSTSPPEDIKEATKEYVAYMYRSKDSQVFDTIADPTAGVITIPSGVPKHVRRLLDDSGYVRKIRIV